MSIQAKSLRRIVGQPLQTLSKFLSDPFQRLRLRDQLRPRAFALAQGETGFDEAERKSRETYVNRMRASFVRSDLPGAVHALKQSILEQAMIEASRGLIERDPTCVVTRPIDDEIICSAYFHTDEIINIMREMHGGRLKLGTRF